VIKYRQNGDSAQVLHFFKDTLWSRCGFYKGNIVYEVTTQKEYEAFEVSANHYSSKYKGMKTTKRGYDYFKDGTLEKVSVDGKTEFEYAYNSPSCSITHYSYDNYEHKYLTFKNDIIKDKAGKISKVVFFEKGKEDHTSVFSVFYDKHGTVVKISRRNKCRKYFDEKDTFYEYKNFYEKGRLVKTIVHYNFNVQDNDIIYTYNDKGLISCIDYGTRQYFFNYTFY